MTHSVRCRAASPWPLGVLTALLVAAQGCSPKACTGFEVKDPVPMEARKKMTMEQALARLDAADAWTDHPPLNLPRHPAEKYLEGWVIVLDPGHGGKSLEVPGWKTGPTGVREAEMNLRVGLMLRELLEDAGAIVGMTRTEETSKIADDRIGDYDHGADVDPDDPEGYAEWGTLQRRAHFANTFPRPDHARPGGIQDADGVFRGADLFISLHHNASSRPEANYTTMWFHGPPEDALVDLDAARHLAREVGYALRTDVGLTSPVMNDQQMYPTGFGVLRHATVPAVLTESSFFSNPEEEQRLDDPGYLLREAHAIYRGLCEMAYAGRPTQNLLDTQFSFHDQPDMSGMGGTGTSIGRLTVKFKLDDGLPDWWGHDLERTLPSTLSASINEQPPMQTQMRAIEETGDHEIALTFMLPLDYTQRAIWHMMKNGSRARGGTVPADVQLKMEQPIASSHILEIKHANFLKAHNWPQRYAVELKWQPDAETPEVVSVTPLGAKR
ncbi:MAG: N-acetylmuramoyl-L-alanine amidase [Planctomycetota bacterium]